MPDRRIPRFLLSLLLSFTPIAAFAQSGGAAAPAARTHRWINWQAATLDTRYRVIENSDAVRLELYQRVEGTQDNGFAVSAERAVTRTVGITAGYADIDEHYGTLNADRFGRGRRVFTQVRAVVLPTLTVTAYYGVAVNTPFAIPNRQRFDLIASWNVLKAVQRAGH